MSAQCPECKSLSMVAGKTQHIFIICNTVVMVPFSMCSNTFYVSGLHIYFHPKKNYQGNSDSNWSPLDLYQVYNDIQNTKGLWWWNMQLYLSHKNLESFIVCVLPRWNLVIHTVSPKLDIVDLTDGLFSLLGKPRLENWIRTHPFQSILGPGCHFFLPKLTWYYWGYPDLVCDLCC